MILKINLLRKLLNFFRYNKMIFKISQNPPKIVPLLAEGWGVGRHKILLKSLLISNDPFPKYNELMNCYSRKKTQAASDVNILYHNLA